MNEIKRLHEGNRDAWDRTARAGYGSEVEHHLELLRSGGTNLMEAELRILGDLSGWCKEAIHLQCSHGFDALSLLNMGAAHVTGVDISQQMIALAQAKSQALGANANWIRADILDTPHELDSTADLVYTGKGGICWMMDLDAWASVVARLLKPGGKLFLFEGHPLDCLWSEESATYVLREGATYFPAAPWAEKGFPYTAALRADPNKPVELTLRVWSIGEAVTAVANAGLRIQHLEEVAEPFWDQFKHIPPTELARLPHTYGLLATKE